MAMDIGIVKRLVGLTKITEYLKARWISFMKLLNEPLTYVAAYVIMIIFTFGHAFNGVPDEEGARIGNITYTVHNGGGTKAFVGFVAGVMWPLYWSVELQEKE